MKPPTIFKRKAGAKPPAAVVRALQREFKECHLYWVMPEGRWALVQIRSGKPLWLIKVFRRLDGSYVAPTYANTIGYLREMHPRNFAQKFAQQRFLQRMDDEFESVGTKVDTGLEGLRHEIAGDVWNKIKGRVVVARP